MAGVVIYLNSVKHCQFKWGRRCVCNLCHLRLNTLRQRQHCRHFAKDIFKCIFFNEDVWILLKISVKSVPNVRINNIPALVKKRLAADQATSLYLNQWWLVYWRIYASLGLNELNKTVVWHSLDACYCPACRTTLVATRFRVAVICPIIQVPHCIRVFFYFVWFVFINHIFQFYYELCTYCNILDIYLS